MEKSWKVKNNNQMGGGRAFVGVDISFIWKGIEYFLYLIEL